MWHKIKNFVLDIIYPIECVGCEKYDEWLCEDCQEKLDNFSYIKNNKNEIPSGVDGILIGASFDNELIRKMIHNFKYKFVQDFKKPLARIIQKKIMEERINGFEINDYDFVVPVPLHRWRESWRGFNQAQLLAQELAYNFRIPVGDSLISRVKFTKTQSKLKKEKRIKNLKNAFKVKKGMEDKIKAKNILVVDDVITSGSTVAEVAIELKRRGAKKVTCVAVAGG
jgi:competence protein ComFC